MRYHGRCWTRQVDCPKSISKLYRVFYLNPQYLLGSSLVDVVMLDLFIDVLFFYTIFLCDSVCFSFRTKV